MTTFHEIVHDADIMRSIDELGFTEPTEIQAATIPTAYEGHDIIGQAKTGSGKTFAFGIPIISHVDTSSRDPQALVLAPTRELCQQIALELKKIAKHKKVRIATIYGGVAINPQIDELEDGAQIVVGTPGRVIDHLQRGTLHNDRIRTLVLDEADRMFDMGFIEDLDEIIRSIPDNRQMLLFSATMPDGVKQLAARHLHEPKHIKTTSYVEQSYLPQYYYVVDRRGKFSLLVHLLRSERAGKCIIFCGTRSNAEAVARNMQRHGLTADELHGGLSQAKRNHVMEDFRKGNISLLIATDVAARGLDIQDVTHVINYDVPRNPEDYIHRIGRTARAGKHGRAITLLEDRDFEFFQAVLNIVPQEPEKMETPEFRNLGFRRDSGEGYGDREGRGPRREGGRPPRRDGGRPPRRDSGNSGYTPQVTYARPEPRQESSGGWKQSMRGRR